MANSIFISALFYNDIHKFPLDLYTVNFYRSHLCITCIHQCLRNLLVPVLLVHLDDLSICNLLHICKNMFLYTGVSFISMAFTNFCRPLPGSLEQIEGVKSGRIGNRVHSFAGVVFPVSGSQFVTEHSSISKQDFPSSPENPGQHSQR